MNGKRIVLVIVTLLVVLCLAMPALAAPKGKKKKGKADGDDWTNRFSFSFGGGGISSSAGFGFEGHVGVGYHITKWAQVTLTPGFGFYPTEYQYLHNDGGTIDPQNPPDYKTEKTNLYYIPIDLAVIFTPVRYDRYSFYVGPGFGVTFAWWTQKEGRVIEVDELGEPDRYESDEVKHSETLYSTFITAGLGVQVAGPFGVSVGLTYTIPDVTEFSFENGTLSFGVGGGVTF
jgi:opacity protein-like surface antigen